MKYSIAICGGGSTYTLPMIKTLCDFSDKFPIEKIILFDNDLEKTELICQAAKVMVSELMGDVKVVLKGEIDEEFNDLDFAFMQIRSGGLKMREKDEKIPLSYDCVGQETCGAGGFAYGLRSVPDVIDIVKNIRKYSPKAWIINYSNPAAIVAEATKRFFPNDNRLINLCDMPIAILDGFAEALRMKRSDLSPRYFGLNHFGWFTNLYDSKGVDLLPKIREMLQDGAMMPEELKKDAGWVNTFNQLSVMTNDLKGHIPNTYLQYYLYPKKIVQKEDKNYTRANSVMDNRLKQVENQCKSIIENGTILGSGLEKGVHGTYIVELAMSIINNENRIFLIITKNNGVISNLPHDAMVEVPCIVNANSCEPLAVDEIDTFYKALIENQYAYEKLTVDALVNNDYDAALKALVLNRTVINVDTAKNILDDLINANKEFWPELRKDSSVEVEYY
ncbi:family 4 glycosyl hydrolase [Clostridioides difficile]